MAVFTLDRVSLAFDQVALLDAVVLQVEPGEHLALVGRNGSGKSTLLKLLAGEIVPDTGTVYRTPALRLAYVPQDPVFDPENTVADVIAQALGPVGDDVHAYHQATAQLVTAQGREAERLMAHVQHLQTRLEHRDGWRLHTRIETVLSRLQLTSEVGLGELSSGWQRRVSLAQALVRDPELLLLDEPTNHLDLVTIDWLESYLLSFAGTVVFVTHDRVFLDRLATGIVELDRGQLRRFTGSWEAYRQHKGAILAVEETVAAQSDRHLAEEEAWLRQGVRARRTRNEGRVRRLMAMREAYQARRESPQGPTFTLATGERSGHLVAEIEHLSKTFGTQKVVDDFSARIMRGDRIGLVGPNGIGKTTLLRLLLEELEPDAGNVRHGTRLTVAYFDQRRTQLDPEATLWETLCPHGGDSVTVAGEQRHVVSYLGEFLFPPESVRGRVKSLSGGERNRLLLARLFTQSANLLVLDEPTNDLDLETLEVLEDLLATYEGTLFLASHDRAFLDGVVTSLYVFEGQGQIREYTGGYSDWQHARQSRPARQAKRHPVQPVTPKPRRGLSYNEKRELEMLPGRIEELEARQADLHTQLHDPDLFHREPENFHAIMEHLTGLESALASAYNRWEELEQRLEQDV